MVTNLFYLGSRKHLKTSSFPSSSSMPNQHVLSLIVIIVVPTGPWPFHYILSPLELFPLLSTSLKLCLPCPDPPSGLHPFTRFWLFPAQLQPISSHRYTPSFCIVSHQYLVLSYPCFLYVLAIVVWGDGYTTIQIALFDTLKRGPLKLVLRNFLAKSPSNIFSHRPTRSRIQPS